MTTTASTLGWPASVADPSRIAVLQTSGDIGGMVMAGVLLLVLGLAGVAVWRGRLSETVGGLLGRSGAAADTGGRVEPDTRPQSTPEPGTEPQEPEEEPAERSDEEVIVDILEDNDGRMKQARIVDATGWSKSKVSMLLSEMEDGEQINKLRVGRENIISLHGHEPDAAGSPFEEE